MNHEPDYMQITAYWYEDYSVVYNATQCRWGVYERSTRQIEYTETEEEAVRKCREMNNMGEYADLGI